MCKVVRCREDQWTLYGDYLRKKCLGNQSAVNIGAVSNRVTHATQCTRSRETAVSGILAKHTMVIQKNLPESINKCCDFAVGGTMTQYTYVGLSKTRSHSKQARARSKACTSPWKWEVKASLTFQRFHRFHSAGASLWRWSIGKDVRPRLLEIGDLLCTGRCCT